MTSDPVQWVPALQVAVGPAILISGVGLLLLVMTNRLGRTVDRVRILAPLARQERPDASHLRAQVDVLWRRSNILRGAISFAVLAALTAALLVLLLFFTAIWRAPVGFILGALFFSCLIFLILSLIGLLRDVNLSLKALALEISSAPPVG